MSNIELTSFILTIASFIISSLLGILAIWLTKYFDSKTSETLTEVKDLTNEIKNLTNTSINHQENVTSKILEKLLNPSPYGVDNSTSSNENGNDLEILFKNLFDEQNQKMDEMKEQITKMNQVTNIGNDETDLLLTLIKWDNFPAFYVLLNAIYQENITNYIDLKNAQPKYGFPTRFDPGIKRLIEEEILIGTKESFEINPRHHKALGKWLDEHQEIIKEIGSIFNKYSDKPDNQLSDDEKKERRKEFRNLTKKLQFKSKKRVMVAKIKSPNK
ncbi:hypothetical protein [Bacillus wiedmannii]|uniref:hypothetical protein n=1 Tax=Bacillus wiedmannii TaxID=1890302 RepID=UPI001C013072|nr:hypothetical protein [Bacillus wiedmannii]QWH69467.1 hypothetical protein EXW41_27410 [Bacillus wiedmannii]